MSTRIMVGDCREQMKLLADASVDCIVTDPPYELTSARPGGRSEATRGKVMGGFMGMEWDGSGIAFNIVMWSEALRVLKPGGHLLAFGGSRTYHRMACAIEDAGFEIRDQIMWVYGSGFPKSLDVSKAIDKAAGANRGRYERPAFGGTFSDDGGTTYGTALSNTPITDSARQWAGWGTALKPAHEPIVVARKPLIGTVAANVLAHGTGALNIDSCRIPSEPMQPNTGSGGLPRRKVDEQRGAGLVTQPNELGRWPANLIHDGSEAIVALFPSEAGAAAPVRQWNADKFRNAYGTCAGNTDEQGSPFHGDSGSAARFFYCAKADRLDRNHGCEHMEKRPLNWSSGDQSPGTFQAEGTDRSAQNDHPTVKPTDLMAYLIRLVGPRGGVVLDPFMGSGSSGRGAVVEGMKFIGIEQDARYAEIARCRIRAQAGLFYVEDDQLCAREDELPDVANG